MLNSKRASQYSGFFLLTFLVFTLGMYSVHKDWLPWQKTAEIRDIVKSIIKTGNM